MIHIHSYNYEKKILYDDLIHYYREMKTILNGIAGLTQLLKIDTLTQEEKKETIEQIIQLSFQLNALTDSFFNETTNQIFPFDYKQLN